MADPRWGTASPGPALRPDPWWLRAIPPELRVVCAVWLACLVLWIVPLATVGKDSPGPSHVTTVVLAVAIGTGLLATLGWGFVLGRRREWTLLGGSILAGALWLCVAYLSAWFLVDTHYESFFGSWVGVVYLYYLTLSLIGLGMLLGLGALVGRVLAPALPPA